MAVGSLCELAEHAAGGCSGSCCGTWGRVAVVLRKVMSADPSFAVVLDFRPPLNPFLFLSSPVSFHRTPALHLFCLCDGLHLISNCLPSGHMSSPFGFDLAILRYSHYFCDTTTMTIVTQVISKTPANKFLTIGPSTGQPLLSVNTNTYSKISMTEVRNRVYDRTHSDG
jgi:hypothetical protein